MLQKICRTFKRRGQTIGVVPTMGFLHEGHQSLLKKARPQCDVLVLTIFVNPTQFGPREDYKKYPRHTKRDLAIAGREKVDLVFLPKVSDLYPAGYQTYVEPTGLSRELCGKSRPGHFRGVTTIVAKLFNIISPNTAFFGLKDFQQFAILCQMVKDLDFGIKMIGIPTLREKDGLAMSSRNAYLNPVERKAALCLIGGLKRVRQEIIKGNKNMMRLNSLVRSKIRKEKLARLDYAECVHAQTLQPLKKYERGKTLFALAVFIGKTRLIDNIVI